MRFSDAAKNYAKHLELERSPATVKGYYGALMQFCLWARNPLITQVYVEQIEEYFAMHLELGWSRNSLVAKSMAFRKFFQYWSKRGYPVLSWESLPIMHKIGVEPRVAKREQIAKLLEVCAGEDVYSIRNRAIILLLADGGMRNGELCSLGADIDTDSFMYSQMCSKCGGEVCFYSKESTLEGDYQTCTHCLCEQDGDPTAEGTVRQFSYVLKTEKRRAGVVHRRVFWYVEANEALKKWIEKRERFCEFFKAKHPDALFMGVKSWRAGHRMSPGTVGLMLRELSAQAGIDPPVNAHSFRHMFGFEAAEHGMNNSNISDLMGHAQLQSSLVYTHLRGSALGVAHRSVKGSRRVDSSGDMTGSSLRKADRISVYGSSSERREKPRTRPQTGKRPEAVDVPRSRQSLPTKRASRVGNLHT